MTALTMITQLFLALPLLAIVVNNLVPRERMRHATIGMSAGVATAQLTLALLGFVLLAASGKSEFRFALAWDLAKGLGYFRVDLVSMFLLACVGLVTLASTMTAFTSIDDHRSSFSNLLMVMMLGMNGIWRARVNTWRSRLLRPYLS